MFLEKVRYVSYNDTEVAQMKPIVLSDKAIRTLELALRKWGPACSKEKEREYARWLIERLKRGDGK